LAVGDCNTWGIIDPPIGNTILDKFCHHLHQQGTLTTSQNLGFGMGTTREGLELVRRQAQAADILLLNFGLVDTWITSIPKIYIRYFPDNPVQKRLRKLLKFVKRHLRSPRLRRLVPTGPVVPAEEYAQNIRAIIRLVRATRPNATVLLWGSPPVQNHPERNANLKQYNLILQAIAADLGAAYLDTAPLIQRLPAESAYLDNVHLNEAATEAIAAQLANAYCTTQLAAAS
jgi:lysophospholipase L1-like esterase